MRTTSYPLAVPEDLLVEVRETAAATGLSLAAAMRQSMRLGLPRLREQLASAATIKPFTKAEAKRAQRAPKPHEVLLDESDGLDWPTLCKCDLLHTFAQADLKWRRGVVSSERRRQIIVTINRAHDWV